MKPKIKICQCCGHKIFIKPGECKKCGNDTYIPTPENEQMKQYKYKSRHTYRCLKCKTDWHCFFFKLTENGKLIKRF